MMIIVKHEKVVKVETETLGLIELGFRVCGYQVYLRIPEDMSQMGIDRIKRRAEHAIDRMFDGLDRSIELIPEKDVAKCVREVNQQ